MASKTFFTPEEEQYLLEARKNGVPYSEISKKLGRSEKTLSNKWVRLTTQGPNKKVGRKKGSKKAPKEPKEVRPFNPDDTATVDYCRKMYMTYYDKYLTVRRLAREFAVKPADIFKLLRDNGVIGPDRVQGEPFQLNPDSVQVADLMDDEPAEPEPDSDVSRELKGYKVSCEIDGAFFKSIDEVKIFIADLNMVRGCEVSRIDIVEINSIKFGGFNND